MLRTMTRCLVCAALLFAAGCASLDGFQKPIADFSTSVQKGNIAIGEAYRNMNPLAREAYYLSVLTDDRVLLAETDSEGRPTPLKEDVWSVDSITARLNALQMLSTYAERLAALAGTDAPQRARAAIARAGGSVSGIDNTLVALRKLRAAEELADVEKGNNRISEIAAEILSAEQSELVNTFIGLSKTKAEDALADISAHEYIVPVSKVLGLLCETYLERRIENELVDAIKDAKEDVDKILELLETDLKRVRPNGELIWKEGRLSLRVYRMDKWNGMDFLERTELVKQFQTLQNKLKLAQSTTPFEIISRIQRAHDALFKYATSDRKKPDLEELIVRLDNLSKDIEVLAEMVLAVSSTQ